MVDRHATVALVWVNAAIAECLGAARKALEHFAAEPGDIEVLADVVEPIHQVVGCLQMLGN